MILAKYDPAVLRSAVQKALHCGDGEWYHQTLQNDVCRCALSSDEEQSVLTNAVKTAENLAQQIKARYGDCSPIELAEKRNLKVTHVSGEICEPYLYMSLYDPQTRTVTLNDDVLSLVRQFISNYQLSDLTPLEDLANIALFHEIFHALEEDTPGIYTRGKMLTRKVLGIFPYMRGLDSVCEVGAIHFSKCMSGISYSPCIYEHYLLLALQKQSIDFLPPNM